MAMINHILRRSELVQFGNNHMSNCQLENLKLHESTEFNKGGEICFILTSVLNCLGPSLCIFIFQSAYQSKAHYLHKITYQTLIAMYTEM